LEIFMSNSIDTRHLRYFVVLADHLHFGKAAASLGIAQPALSQQISRLERELACKLVERRPRVALTQAGIVLLAEARQVLAALDYALASTLRSASGETGILSVGFASSAVLTHFSKIVSEYRRKFPNVLLSLRELAPQDETAAVRAGVVDVAFVREISADPDLRFDIIAKESLVVVLPRHHKLTESKTVRLESLRNEPFIHFPREIAPSLYDQIQLACRGAGFQPRVVQDVREWLTELSLVRAGLGVAIVPSSLEAIRPTGVTFRPIRGRASKAAIALCYSQSRLRAPAAAFLETAGTVVDAG
jgi:DNA-binding transcriptional LysR family regulator